MRELKKLNEFAKLVLKIGVNLQKGQGLEIVCPVEKRDVALEMTKVAYDMGAKIVRVRWEDDEIAAVNFTRAEKETLAEVPKWQILYKNYLLEKGFCYVAIAAEDPTAFKNVPSDKLAFIEKARAKALKKFSDAVMENQIRWCVASVPTYAWAKQVFPSAKDPEDALWTEILKTMRLDGENPLAAWEEHLLSLRRRAEFLNGENFSCLRYANGLGTDLTVGLADGHVWLAAEETGKDGFPFVANIPTEEIFTCPHRQRTDGVVKSSMPLCYNGQIIDGFSLTFKRGKIVDFSAEKGEDTLKELINAHKGNLSIGECALIDKTSPIKKSGVLFFNTLFDENASCHLALGKAYPTTVRGGDNMTAKELKKRGVNDSPYHVDFMIGTDDLSVVGVKNNGEEIPLIKDGAWVI